MSLRIRRGTDSQRQGITPLEGELLYATDTKKLYVGDGSTGGGIVVDSSAGTSTLNDLANVSAGSPNTNDIIKWSGSAWITAAQNAPAALNDLTNVSASPTTGESLIWSGSAWVAGQPYGDGSDLNSNIIGDDSTIMVNTATKTITARLLGDVMSEDGVSTVINVGAVGGQALFTGDLEGNLIGGVYTDNSTKIIDAQTGLITGDLVAPVSVTTVGEMTTPVMRVEGASTQGTLHLRNRNGAAAVADQDSLGRIVFGEDDVTPYWTVGVTKDYWSASPNPTGTPDYGDFFQVWKDGRVQIGGETGGSGYAGWVRQPVATLEVYGNVHITNASELLLGSMTTTQRNALTAVNGMLVYNTTTNKFEGYENGSWVSLVA
jgi:hypothetical protein